MGDAQPAQCSNLDRTARRTVAVAIELAGVSIRDSREIIDRVLDDEKVRDALADALKKAGQELMDQQVRGQAVPLDQSLGRVGSAAAGVLRGPTEAEIRKLPEFKRLEQNLREFKCAFDSTPVGVFVNENKTLLIVVGVAAAIGGGVAMYYARAGDTPAGLLSQLPSLDIVKIGGVTVSVGNIRFAPSKREVSETIRVQGQWGGVKASLELSSTFANDSLRAAGAASRLELKLDPRLTTHIAGSLRWSQGDLPGQPTTTATAEIGMQQRLSTRSTLQLRLFGEFADGPAGQQGRVGVGGEYEITRPFGRGTRLSGRVDGSLGGPLSPSRLPDVPAPGLQSGNQSPAGPSGEVMFRLQFQW